MTLSTLQCASSFGSGGPSIARVARTISSTLDDLQLNITLQIHERIYEFFLSLALPSLTWEPLHSVERKEKRWRYNGWQGSGTRPPHTYLKKGLNS